MPQTNTLKQYAPYAYYHVYTRGANKQKIFLEAADYHYFISLFARYLSSKPVISKSGIPYPIYNDKIQLLSFCLMNNHIHLLVYQKEDRYAIKKFMSSMMTSYSMYFNLKYNHRGTIFESRYKAKKIDNETYLAHISRYIHMNPRYWLTWNYSSLRFVFNKKPPEWLNIEKITSDFKNRNEYMEFLSEYQSSKDALKEVKDQLSQI